MFGRKRIRELEKQLEGLRAACASEYREAKSWRKLYEQKHQRLADREARHEMDVKGRLDEYGTAILANERDIRALAERGERRTISDMVSEQADMDKVSTARIMDEWLNGKSGELAEGTDDE